MGIVRFWPGFSRITRSVQRAPCSVFVHPLNFGRLPVLLPVLLGLLWVGPVDAEISKEYQIKAVLLFNLSRFVDWPDSAFTSPDAPLVIGIVGRDPFGQALDEAVRGEEVNGRRIVVERFPTARSVRPCQILFIGENERPRVSGILANLKDRSVLTVSELPDFATSSGGIIRLYTNNQNKVRLQVNLTQAQADKLKLSSKLLQVAEVVRK